MVFGKSFRKTESKVPELESEVRAQLLSGSWEDFEAWVGRAIGGGFTWKVRPRDTAENRQMVIDSILSAMERNNGTFPRSDVFLERDDD